MRSQLHWQQILLHAHAYVSYHALPYLYVRAWFPMENQLAQFTKSMHEISYICVIN